jgi:hypothetical protein
MLDLIQRHGFYGECILCCMYFLSSMKNWRKQSCIYNGPIWYMQKKLQ